MYTHRKLDASSLVVLLLAVGATASTFALTPTTPTSDTAANSDHAHDQHDHQPGGLPPLDGTTEATLERFLAIDPDVLSGAHDHDHASGHAAADASDRWTKRNGGVRGPGSPAG